MVDADGEGRNNGATGGGFGEWREDLLELQV